MKTKKSKRRPGKSAHVAVDVKPTAVYIHSYGEIFVTDASRTVRISSPCLNDNNNNKRICIAQVCRMTSEALGGQL